MQITRIKPGGRLLGPTARAQFQISPPTIDLQPYDALNEAASQWRTQMK